MVPALAGTTKTRFRTRFDALKGRSLQNSSYYKDRDGYCKSFGIPQGPRKDLSKTQIPMVRRPCTIMPDPKLQ